MRGLILLAGILALLLHQPVAYSMAPVYNPDSIIFDSNITWTYIDDCIGGRPCVVGRLSEKNLSILVVLGEDDPVLGRHANLESTGSKPVLPPDIALQLLEKRGSRIGELEGGKLGPAVAGSIFALMLLALATARRLVSA